MSDDTEQSGLSSWTCPEGHRCGRYDLICYQCEREKSDSPITDIDQ